MAFEIGERVTSSWTGPGTIIGPLTRDEENVPHQLVRVDKPLFGKNEVLRPIAKLLPYVDPKPKRTYLLDMENPVKEVVEYTNPQYPPPALLGSFDNVKSVRVIASEVRDAQARDLFQRLDITFPGDWRGTIRGKRGGSTVQYGISAIVTFKDGTRVQDARLVLRALHDGRAQGWRITESA